MKSRYTKLLHVAKGSSGRWLFVLLLSVLALFLLAACQPVTLKPTIIEYPIPTFKAHSGGIVNGPDGALWFVETGVSKIGRITTDGTVKEYPILTDGAIESGQGFLGVGPDGALWFNENNANKLGRITMKGEVTEYALPKEFGTLVGFAAAADGGLWTTVQTINAVVRFTPDGQVAATYKMPTAISSLVGIILGPDGALWFVDADADQIGRLTTDGQLTEYPIPTAAGHPLRLTVGPDKALWFTMFVGNKIGRITMAGEVTEFDVPGTGPVGITTGRDGVIWFTAFNINKIGRLTLDGGLTLYDVPNYAAMPYHIVSGPDGNLWFTEIEGNKIGKIILPTGTASAAASDTTVAASDSATAASTGSPVDFVWRIKGDPNRLGRPMGMAFDAQDNLYVIDGNSHRIQKFDRDGKFLLTWGSRGSEEGQFVFRNGEDHPGAIAINAQGEVYVADYSGFVQVFDGQGKFLRKWGGGFGTGDGQFITPRCMAFDEQGDIYLSDAGPNDPTAIIRIEKFDADGNFLLNLGVHQSYCMALDGQSNVYVANSSKYRIEKYDSQGTLLTTWGSQGKGDGQFAEPEGIAADAQGNVYVADNASNFRIEKFDSNGNFLGKWGDWGSEDGQFNYPRTIAVDSQGNIYVADDGGNDSIQKFHPR